MAKIFAMIIRSYCDGILIWWLFIIRAFSQLPELSLVARHQSFGRCVSLESSMLGDFHYPSSLGLVPYSLLASARRNQSSIYYTNDLPSVRVMRSVRTCESRDVLISHYNTVSFLVSYTCRGVACEQLPDSVRNVSYVHLFSFICRTNNRYTSWNFIPGYEVHINRTSTNSISHPMTAPSGSCALCTNDPAFKNNPRFDPVTGCITCKPECLSVGFGLCTTSIGDDAKQACCSYWYQPVGAKSRMCAQNCPPPYFESIDSSTGDCIKRISMRHEGMSSSPLNIFCKGDTFTLNCSTLLSAHNLTWQITYPGKDPVNITYNEHSSLEALGVIRYSGMEISSTFTRNALRIVSVITLNVSNESSIDGTEVKCSMSRLEPAVIHIQYDSLGQAPSAPARFLATEQHLSHYHDKSIGLLTLQWDPAQISPQSVTQWYELEISPQPLSAVVQVASSPVNVTLRFDVNYVASLRAVNCIGSSPSLSILLQLEKFPGPRAYINNEKTNLSSINHVIAEHGNSSLNFSCSSYSGQPTNLTWNVETSSGILPIEAAQVSHSKQCQKLMWKRPALFRDSGVYSCTASNRNGAKTAKLKVNVMGLATIVSITPSEPLFFSSSSSVKVAAGYTEVVLTCTGTSWPPPLEVKWVNSTMHTLSSSTRILNIRFISAVLRFERGFRITDAGMYTCIVQGNVTSQSGVITLEQTETAVTTERMECKLNSATAYFQIRVLSTSCSLWDASTLRVTEANLVDAVTVSITSQCRDCDPGSAEIVITNRTACIKGAALFKGRITSSPAQTKLLFCELQEWQRTGPIIHLTNDRTLLFQVDRACTVKSESLTSSKCSMDSSNSSTLLAFSSGAVLFLVIVIISSIAGMVGTQIHRRNVAATLENQTISAGDLDLDEYIHLDDDFDQYRNIYRRSMYELEDAQEVVIVRDPNQPRGSIYEDAKECHELRSFRQLLGDKKGKKVKVVTSDISSGAGGNAYGDRTNFPINTASGRRKDSKDISRGAKKSSPDRSEQSKRRLSFFGFKRTVTRDTKPDHEQSKNLASGTEGKGDVISSGKHKHDVKNVAGEAKYGERDSKKGDSETTRHEDDNDSNAAGGPKYGERNSKKRTVSDSETSRHTAAVSVSGEKKRTVSESTTVVSRYDDSKKRRGKKRAVSDSEHTSVAGDRHRTKRRIESGNVASVTEDLDKTLGSKHRDSKKSTASVGGTTSASRHKKRRPGGMSSKRSIISDASRRRSDQHTYEGYSGDHEYNEEYAGDGDEAEYAQYEYEDYTGYEDGDYAGYDHEADYSGYENGDYDAEHYDYEYDDDDYNNENHQDTRTEAGGSDKTKHT